MTAKTEPTELADSGYTHEQMNRELARWSASLAEAKSAGNILAMDTARRFLDRWLDRKINATQ